MKTLFRVTELKKYQLNIGLNNFRGPKRCLTDIEVNIKPIPSTQCPLCKPMSSFAITS